MARLRNWIKWDTETKHFLILVFFTSMLLPLLCAFMRDSVFYRKPKDTDKEKMYMKQVDQQRLKESLEILGVGSNGNVTLRHPLFRSRNITVGVTIITVSRNRHKFDTYEPKYLTQVAGKIVSSLQDPQLEKTYSVFLCNVDPDPENYKEISPLSKILPTFQRFHAKIPKAADIFEKEKQDYLFCLNETLNRNVDFAFLVEDDAYPSDMLFPVLEHVVDHRIMNKFSELKSWNRQVTYVKFYHPPRILGYYSPELERIPGLICISVLFGTILCQLYVLSSKRSKINVNKLWFLFCVYFCFVAMGIGRQNIMKFRYLSKHLFQVTPAPACCTPALLFTQHGGRKVIEYMQHRTCRLHYGKDSLLEDVRRKYGLTGLLVQPNLFHHIGMYSSLRVNVLDPFIV